MRGETGEQRLRLVAVEPRPSETSGRSDPAPPESGEMAGMRRRELQGRQQAVGQFEAGIDEWPHQASIRSGIGSETGGGVVDRAFEHGSASAVEWMGDRNAGVHPVEAVRSK